MIARPTLPVATSACRTPDGVRRAGALKNGAAGYPQGRCIRAAGRITAKAGKFRVVCPRTVPTDFCGLSGPVDHYKPGMDFAVDNFCTRGGMDAPRHFLVACMRTGRCQKTAQWRLSEGVGHDRNNISMPPSGRKKSPSPMHSNQRRAGQAEWSGYPCPPTTLKV